MKKEVSRQRIAQIRQYILRDIIVWTVQAPHRIVLFATIWDTFHSIVYKREQKIKDGMRFCPRCQALGRECWHPLEGYNKNTAREDKLSVYCRTCEREKQAIFRSKHPERAEKYRQAHDKRHPGIWSVYRKRSYRKHRT